ncbi:fimbrial biogenesis chaperone [Pseudomonas putida]|uniref:Molecular chaperone n=1 Tax=Pseudomonas putida TaxID=303 RepID=A0AAW5HSY7_PSEPU|nr:molecular chaperone [Pseudomonas putida]MCO1624125.1 molecular chaperone [Pseudomonas putida]
MPPRFPSFPRKVVALLALLCLPGNVWAQLKVEGTRLIYLGSDKEASINVINRSSEETVMQSWVSHPDHSGDIPFAIVQPLTMLPPRSHQMLRVLYAGQGLPTDRESMFWLNILEIPRKSEHADSIQFAVRQRLKLFYRPAGLQGSTSDAVRALQWHRYSQRIEIRNPSAFHLSLVDLALEGPGLHEPLKDYVLLQPGASITLNTRSPVPTGSRVTFTEIADSGLLQSHTASLP